MLKRIVRLAAVAVVCLTASANALAIETTRLDSPLPMPPLPPSMTQVI